MRLALGLATVLAAAAVDASAATCPLLDSDTLRCQQGVGRAGAVYVRSKMKAVQQCLNKIQNGDLMGDPVTVCRGTPGVPPTDPQAASKIARAEGRVADILAGKCSDATVAFLDLCAETVAGLATCLVADHWARTDAAIAEEYGTLVPSGNAGEQACQATIAKEAGKYLSARAKAIARCIDTRNKRECGDTDPISNCLLPSLDGPRAEKAAATKILRAETKMREKVIAECSNPEITALDACADTAGPLEDCLVCTHNNAAALLVAGQYQAVQVTNPTGPSLQSVADAAQDGDTIFLEPGTYLGQTMELKDSNLSVIGIKTCDTGARPVIVNDPLAPHENGIESCGSLIGGCTDVADNLLLQSLEVNDFDENDVWMSGVDGVTYRDMITRGPGTPTGTEYGLFPVLSNDVLIEDCLVTGVRDAGIYVGQSTNIVVRNNVVHSNVAGIEIENSANAEVYGNYAYENTAGILVFKLAGLSVQLSNCHHIHDNYVYDNNVPNFGSGLVGDVPRGTGMLILSNDTTLFQGNVVTGNDTFGIVLTDQNTLNLLDPMDPPFPTPSPDQASEHNFFFGNAQTGNGTNPDPSVPATFASNGAVVITGGSPGVGNCAETSCDSDDDCNDGLICSCTTTGCGGSCNLPRFCKLAPHDPCTSDAQCPDPDPEVNTNWCFGSFLWNVLPACAVPPSPPGCGITPGPTSTSTTSTTSTTLAPFWAASIHPSFVSKCFGCHGGEWGSPTCNTAHASLVNIQSSYTALDLVEPFDSTLSFLVHMIAGTQDSVPGGENAPPQMPLGCGTPGNPCYSQGDIDSISAWIDGGAANDCP